MRPGSVLMNIEELPLGTRAYGVLKAAGIDTIEELCLFTAEQLRRLGNFGQKSLDEVKDALKERSLSLNTGPANSRLLLSFPATRGTRFNLASVSDLDCERLARYTVRELASIQESLLRLASQLTEQPRRRLLSLSGHVDVLRSIHETVLAQSTEQLKAEGRQDDPDMSDE